MNDENKPTARERMHAKLEDIRYRLRYRYNTLKDTAPIGFIAFMSVVVLAICFAVGNGIRMHYQLRDVALRVGMLVRRDTAVYLNRSGAYDTALFMRSRSVYMRGRSIEQLLNVSIPALFYADIAFANVRFDSVITTKDTIYVVSWYGSSVYRPVNDTMRWVRTY